MKFFGKNSKSNLKKKYSQEGIVFQFSGKNPPVFPLNRNDSKVLSKLLPEGGLWSTLERLWSDGLLQETGENTWQVPYDIYDNYDFVEDSDLFLMLNLPLPEPLDSEVKSHSDVGDKAFRINVEISHPDFGPLREGDPLRFGHVFYISEEDVVPLTEEQRALFDEAKGEGVDWNSLEERMSYLAKTKQAALGAKAKIDAYLENEEYQFRSEASVDLREDSPEEITIIPQVEGVQEYGIKSGEELIADTTPAVITKTVTPTIRKRLVLDKELREKLSKLPSKGKIKGADVPRFLTNPEQIIPEGFDLSKFSERVKGFKTRVYNSRPYIHIKKSNRGWFEGIPGIELEDWSPSESSQKTSGETDAFKGLSRENYQKLVKKARETGEEYIQYEGSWIRIDPESGEKFEKILIPFEATESGSYIIPAGSILEIYENLELLEFIDKSSLAAEDQAPLDIPKIEVPETFNGELFPYQLTGYRWLSWLSNYKVGGLLADEMGLGKTIQAIVHLLFLKKNGVKGPHLFVVPKTLMDNWQREIQKFAEGNLKVYQFDGLHRVFDIDLFHTMDVVLTTYETLRRDQTEMGTVDWNLILCDEAQYVKNPTAQRTSAVKAMKSKHRAALTGTPVENGLIEFWCIMDFVQPGLLGSWADFRSNYEHPIVEGDEEEREEKVQELLGQIKGYYLRRLKSEYMKDLPSKNKFYREVPIGEAQFEVYKAIARQGKSGGKGAALAAIQKLLIISAHPRALDLPYIQAKDALKTPCPKLEQTLEIIREVKNRSEKIIIFTDFKAVQRILQQAITKHFGVWPDIINGEINNNRQLMIDKFSEKEGFNVIILGHLVGGVGLNITAANHVIHYTRPWNPAKENQATDRVHRIGQEKPVNIYYPFVKDERFVTVEEKLDELIRSKEDLARDVLRPSSEFKVSREELLNCLDLKEQ